MEEDALAPFADLLADDTDAVQARIFFSFRDLFSLPWIWPRFLSGC